MKTLLAHIDATAPETLTLNGREHIAAFASFLRAAEALRLETGAFNVWAEKIAAYDAAKRAAFPEDYR